MGGFWRRFTRRVQPRRRRLRSPSAAERFAFLRAIGCANDTFLDELARRQEEAEGVAPLRLGAVAETYEALSAPVGAMVRALMAMSGGRYLELARRYEALDRELALVALQARPLGFGALVVWPDEPSAERPDVVGPKAARLAEIAETGDHDVPLFFVVTAHGFRLFMEASGVQDLLERARASTDLSGAAGLSRFSGSAVAAVLGAPLPPALGEALEKATCALVERTGGAAGLAVRSSAVVEDTTSSFAGQFESVLNVPPADVAAAYRRVIASAFRVEALRYALSRGFVDQDVTMPVLVMEMVEPRASGIAYSRSPDSPWRATITAVPGLAQSIADGRGVPDVFQIADADPPRVDEVVPGSRSPTLRCAPGGGLEEVPGAGAALALDGPEACRIAGMAWSLERRFGGAQDVEWALDHSGRLYVVQARPLRLPAPWIAGRTASIPPGHRVLVRGGTRASGGTASGAVVRLSDPTAPGDVPEGCILVVPATSPRLAAVLGSVAGVVAATGSATGHMATVAREFGVPCLVGVGDSVAALSDGEVVTLDADARVVFEGVAAGRVGSAAGRTSAVRRDPVRENVLRLLAHVSPLTLTGPASAVFDPGRCISLHDVARFVHQRAMAEMFALEDLTPSERRSCRRLRWPRPMEILLLDLGGAVAPGAGRCVSVDELTSAPFAALLEGMMDSRVRWAGPVGFDLKGFVSVVVRSAADDQRFGEPSYAICSSDYVHFASRLAYHFATVEAICGASVNESYVRFRFQGGAAVADRREWRARFLASVLRRNGFAVWQAGDRVDAVLPKRPREELEDSLVMLGRLMASSRHLDMLIESPAVASALSEAFLSGDYGFEKVRRGPERGWEP